MKYKVLVTAPYLQTVIEEYREIFNSHQIATIVPKVEEKMSEGELLEWFKKEKDIDGIICGDDEITEQVLASAPNLRVISKWGTGISSIDLEATARRGIPVRNTPNAFTEPVADTVFSFILSFARQTPWSNQEVRSGSWKKLSARALSECVLGIVGLGNIGQAVARRAPAFKMRVLGTDIEENVKKISPDFIQETNLETVSLERVLKESDFISLNCTLGPTSYHLLNEERLVLMKSTAYLINTSRGAVIDEKALIKALFSKKIAGAGLDVFEEEPLSQDSPLRKFPNVLLSPHNANASPTAWQRVHKNTINNLIEELTKREK